MSAAPAEETRRVLITGFVGALAGKLAARLEADERVTYLAGLDLGEALHPDLERTEFIRADLRSPLVAKVVESARVDTIAHLALTPTAAGVGGRARMKELNVIGTMQLLAVAQKAPRLRRLVMKSSTAVYGSSHSTPSLLSEDHDTARYPHRGYAKDTVEAESYARAFARRRRDATMTLLRLANVMGPTHHSPLTRYFELPVVPTALGFDPRVQLLHEDDAVEVLYRAVMAGHPGTFNVAAPGVIYLSQALRMAGKPSVPVPPQMVDVVGQLIRRSGWIDFSPEQLDLLLYGRVGDISRMRRVFDYEPAYSTRATFEAFLESGRVEPVIEGETILDWEQALRRWVAGRTEPAGGRSRA